MPNVDFVILNDAAPALRFEGVTAGRCLFASALQRSVRDFTDFQAEILAWLDRRAT